MRCLLVGIITQVGVILSIQYIFRYKDNGGGGRGGCVWPERGAKRGVLILSHSMSEEDGRARGHVEYQQTLVQWDELFPVLSGVKDHVVFGLSYSIFSSVDVVFYFGPDGVIDRFKSGNRIFPYTYPKARLNEEPLKDNDKFVFKTLHEVFSSAQSNHTIQEALVSKVLFVVYLTSVALAGLKYQNNETVMHDAQHFINQETSKIEKLIRIHYSDLDTVFLSVPHSSILKNRNPKLSVWGRGASKNFSSNIELADVCPLLATLLGVPIPQGSVGRLPVSFLNISEEEEAKGLACNAIQLHQLVFSPSFPYQKLSISTIMDYVSQKKYAQSMVLSEQIIQKSQSYLHRSQQTFDKTIFSIIVISLIGWIFVLIIITMIDSSTPYHVPMRSSFAIITFCSAILLCEILYVVLALEDPLIYIVFMLTSLLPWMLVLMKYKIIWNWCLGHANVKTLLNICSVILIEELLNASFDGGFLTIFVLTLIGSLPLLPRFHKTPFLYSVGWYASCGLIIGLLNIPSELLKVKRKLINFAATFWLCYGQSSVFYFKFKYDAVISQILVFYLALSTVLTNTFILVSYAQPYWYYLSWLTFSALIFPLLGKNKTFNRLIHFSLSFGPLLLLMSRHIESLSYFVLVSFFTCWVYLERSHVTADDDHWCDLRRGVLLVFSCCLSYLLIGKIEAHSPTSFLYPFMPISVYLNNPFPYYAMLFFKHVGAHATLMTIYISLISNKWKSDLGFVYGLIFMEMICLRFLLQFLFFDNISEVVLKNIFFNVFAISYMLSYCIGKLYSSKYEQKEIKDLSILEFLQTYGH